MLMLMLSLLLLLLAVVVVVMRLRSVVDVVAVSFVLREVGCCGAAAIRLEEEMFYLPLFLFFLLHTGFFFLYQRELSLLMFL